MTTTDKSTTSVPAFRATVIWSPRYLEAAQPGEVPETVWLLVDGRVLATYEDGCKQMFTDRLQFSDRHPSLHLDSSDDRQDKEVSIGLYWSTDVHVDWAKIRSAVWKLHQARYPLGPNMPGKDGYIDVFGGSPHYTQYTTLPDLVRLVEATGKIAHDAWDIVHNRPSIECARHACRVAIACSRVFSLLHKAGLIDDPSHRICGTGPGYGLTGLKWIAGHAQDAGCTTEEVDTFAAGGPLPYPEESTK